MLKYKPCTMQSVLSEHVFQEFPVFIQAKCTSTFLNTHSGVGPCTDGELSELFTSIFSMHSNVSNMGSKCWQNHTHFATLTSSCGGLPRFFPCTFTDAVRPTAYYFAPRTSRFPIRSPPPSSVLFYVPCIDDTDTHTTIINEVDN
jgi:hypothetical protein